jgi:hypothetical protein
MSRLTETRSRRRMICQRPCEPYLNPAHWKSLEHLGDGGRYVALDACLVALQEIVRLREIESYWTDVMQDLRKKKRSPLEPW